jgi:hypothetical protein
MELTIDESKWRTNQNRGPPRPQSIVKQTALLSILQQLLDSNIIQPSQATEYSQVLLVPKPDKSWRLCIDYRSLNATMTSLGWPIPNIKRLLHRLGAKRAKYFAVLDLTAGYHQMPLSEKSRHYAAFITDFGVFEPTRISMGLKTAPAYFQQQLALALSGLLYAICEIYMDDVIVFGRTHQEFLANLRRTFQRLKELNLLVSPKKARIGLESLEYLGHVIDSTGLSMSSDRIHKLLEMKKPATVKQLKQFLGIANYFRDFIPNYSVLTHSLYAFLTNYEETRMRKIDWQDDTNQAYQQVLDAIQLNQKLYFVDPNASIFLETDASDYGIGAFLYQLVDGQKQPIQFISKSLNKTQRNWSTIEKECYAIWYALKSMDHLLRDVHFTIRTDHKNLQYLNINTPKVVRWKLAIQEFNFNIEYLKGLENDVADSLSRLCDDDDTLDDTALLPAEALNNTSITQQQPFSVSKKLFKLISSVHNTLQGHFGVELTVKKLQERNISWPNMRQTVKFFIHQRCPVCQKLSQIKPVIVTKPFTTASYSPMERISIDSVGPLPTSDGYQHILVIIDNFTRFVELYPCKTLEADEAATYINIHCGRYGTPYQMLSDNGTQFSNEKLRAICALLQLEHVLTTPYSKQENAIVERANKEVLRHLRAFIFDNRILETWLYSVPMVQRIINSTKHAAIGVSPAQLLFGNAVDLDRGLYTVDSEQFQSSVPDIQQWYDRMLANQAILIGIAQQLQQQQDDRHTNIDNDVNYSTFDIGSYVLVQYPNSQMGHKPPTKLHTHWKGPYRVVNAIETKYTIQNLVNLKCEDVHVSRLKQFLYDPTMTNPEEVALSDSQSFVIEKVNAHRGDTSRVSTLQFQVKWLGDDQLTWEPWKNVRTNQALHAYLKKVKLSKLIPKQYR